MIKILHVEDDADIREIAQLALGLSGDFEVVQSASGEEALLMVQAFIPDVLLLDVMMPGMTGRQTLERMREIPALEKTPAIFMTARAQNSEVEELRGYRWMSHLQKWRASMSLGDQIKAALKAYAEA